MALERVPADIRKQGGVARMCDPKVRAPASSRYTSLKEKTRTLSMVETAQPSSGVGGGVRSKGKFCLFRKKEGHAYRVVAASWPLYVQVITKIPKLMHNAMSLME